ncbi:MAG: hypothetical protein M1531_05910, partial [Chloroflexi bacterium]|nr:hypothetical protein [Chloroflexota bacterium]
RVGMAEVSLTMDNEDGWLGFPYSEVTITRRAHRSGENECLLNASRVRLRDINDLLSRAHAGQTGYTILGQGMVDAVLSWRPEERRTLIDETAQLRLPQAQLEEARQRLSQAQEDMARLEMV